MEYLEPLKAILPWLEMALYYAGGLWVTGLAYVAATPTKKDDGIVAWIEKHPVLGLLPNILVASSPVQRKDKRKDK